MRMKFTFKSLLLAASLLVGSTNALAETGDIASLPFNKVWTADDVTGNLTTPFDKGTVVQGSGVVGLRPNKNEVATALFDSDAVESTRTAYALTDGETVTVSFTAFHGWSANTSSVGTFSIVNSEGVTLAGYKYAQNAMNITSITLGGEEVLTGTITCQSKYNTASSKSDANGFTGSSQYYVDTEGYNPVITITINKTGYITYNVKLSSKDVDASYSKQTSGIAIDLSKITLEYTDNAGNNDLEDRALGLNNLSITSEISTTPTTLYTVKYVDEAGEQLKEPESFRAEVGTTPTISHDDLRVDDKKYKYVSDDATVLVEGDGNVITVTYKEYDKVNYTVNATIADGTVLEKLTEGIGYVGDEVKYFYKQVLNYNGTLYQAAAINSGYSKTFTLEGEGEQVVKHEYSQPATAITNIVYLTEGEDVFTEGAGSNADIRCSMGKGGFASEKMEFATLPAGKYYMVVGNRCSADKGGAIVHSFYQGEEDTPYFTISGQGSNMTYTSEEFTLSEETTLYMLGGDRNNIVDWLYIYGTETTEVSVEVSEAGYTTFSSEYTVNLDELPEGLEAYYVKDGGVNEGESTVTISPAAGNVKAGEGLVFKGEADTYSIPVGKAGAALSGNLLVAVAKAEKVDAGNYVFAYDSAKPAETAGFYRVGSEEAEVPAGKAYLQAGAANAKTLRIVFGDETATAIEALAAEAAEEGTLYNVAGQQVGADYKGIVIKNGKKYLNK